MSNIKTLMADTMNSRAEIIKDVIILELMNKRYPPSALCKELNVDILGLIDLLENGELDSDQADKLKSFFNWSGEQAGKIFFGY